MTKVNGCTVLAFVAALFSGACSDPEAEDCPGLVLEQGGTHLCVVRKIAGGSGVVIESGFQCPDALPLLLPVAGGTVCSDRPIAVSEMPQAACDFLGTECAANVAGSPSPVAQLPTTGVPYVTAAATLAANNEATMNLPARPIPSDAEVVILWPPVVSSSTSSASIYFGTTVMVDGALDAGFTIDATVPAPSDYLIREVEIGSPVEDPTSEVRPFEPVDPPFAIHGQIAAFPAGTVAESPFFDSTRVLDTTVGAVAPFPGYTVLYLDGELVGSEYDYFDSLVATCGPLEAGFYLLENRVGPVSATRCPIAPLGFDTLLELTRIPVCPDKTRYDGVECVRLPLPDGLPNDAELAIFWQSEPPSVTRVSIEGDFPREFTIVPVGPPPPPEAIRQEVPGVPVPQGPVIGVPGPLVSADPGVALGWLTALTSGTLDAVDREGPDALVGSVLGLAGGYGVIYLPGDVVPGSNLERYLCGALSGGYHLVAGEEAPSGPIAPCPAFPNGLFDGVGWAEAPAGLATPLHVNHECDLGSFCVPLAP